MKPRKIEDRTIVISFDVSDGKGGVVVRYNVTSANTVIVQESYADSARKPHTYEKAFPDLMQAFAYAIEQTGCGMVVEHLVSWEELNAPTS